MKVSYFVFLLTIITPIISSCDSEAGYATDTENIYSLGVTVADSNNQDVKFIASSTFNFGSIKVGDTINHTFKFRNVGNSPLVIEHVSPACGCTVAKFNSAEIPVGDIDSVVVQFVADSTSLGFQNKVVNVKMNSSSTPLLLTLFGRVVI